MLRVTGIPDRKAIMSLLALEEKTEQNRKVILIRAHGKTDTHTMILVILGKYYYYYFAIFKQTPAPDPGWKIS